MPPMREHPPMARPPHHRDPMMMGRDDAMGRDELMDEGHIGGYDRYVCTLNRTYRLDSHSLH